MDEIIFHCAYIPHLLYTFLCWWTPRLMAKALPQSGPLATKYHEYPLSNTENPTASSQGRQTRAHTVNIPPESPWSLGNAQSFPSGLDMVLVAWQPVISNTSYLLLYTHTHTWYTRMKRVRKLQLELPFEKEEKEMHIADPGPQQCWYHGAGSGQDPCPGRGGGSLIRPWLSSSGGPSWPWLCVPWPRRWGRGGSSYSVSPLATSEAGVRDMPC